MENNDTPVKHEKWETKSNKGVIFLIILAAIILVSEGLLYLKNAEAVWSKQVFKRLKNVSILKAGEVEEWRQERLSDVWQIAQSQFIRDAFSKLENHRNDEHFKSEIHQKLLNVLQNNTEFVDVLITDTTGQILMTGKTISKEVVPISNIKIIREVIRTNEVIFSDLIKSSSEGIVFTDIASPILNNRHEIVGGVLVRLDTKRKLCPILRASLIDSTEETFLFEKVGDSISYLTDLRQWTNATLSLKISLTSNENPAVMAIRNGPGFYEGVGYNGQKVLEYIQPIRGTPWFLASKIDRDELFRLDYQYVKTISVILLLIFILLSTALLLIIAYRRKHFYSQIIENERQQTALKNHYEYVVKYANDIILLEDKQLNIIDANQRAQQAYQYSLEELLKMKIIDLINSKSKQQIETRLKNIAGNDGTIIEEIHQRKDGSLFYVEISARIITVDGRDFLHQVIRDITDRKQVEIALNESEERFRTTLFSADVGIITTDINGLIQYMNPVAEILTGWKEIDGIRKPFKEIFRVFNEETRTEAEDMVDNVLVKGMRGQLSDHVVLRSKDGIEIPIGDSVAPLRNAEGKITGVVLVFRDQTIERNAQKALEQSNRLKTAFLATMSHELRTPLNAIIGFSGLIEKNTPLEDIYSFAKMINASGNNLLDIVEGILDLTLLKSGESKINHELFSLSSFMESLINLAYEEQQRAERQQIEFEYVSWDSDEPPQLYSDKEKITKVFIHLFRNAFKFTPSGKVKFGYTIASEEINHLKFFVTDTGIGIPENKRSIIFEQFQQAEDCYNRKYGGTGIGLSIAKYNVELLGGQIGVDSTPGKGSTFYFTIPIFRPEYIHNK